MKRIASLFSIAVIVLASCQKEDMELGIAEGIDAHAGSKYISLTKAQADLTASANIFAFKLFNQVRVDRNGETILLSPFSASMALGMTATGAEGETERQMRAVLGFGEVTKEEMTEYYSKMLDGLAKADPYVDLKIANSIWIHKDFPVKEAFVRNAEKAFDSIIENRDFGSPATLKEINDWVSDKTEGTIKDLLDELSPDARMALVNALYFEGKWRYAFAGSKKAPFSNASGGRTRTDMMYAVGTLSYADRDGWELLRLPYGTGAFSMSIILPPEGVKFQGTTLDYDRWLSLNGTLRPCEVNMNIPAFMTRDEFNLIDPLKALGMTDAFGMNADFSAMSDKALYIGKVKQKTFIEVSETGTKASAATVVEMRLRGANPGGYDVPEYQPEKVNFDADRPFYFVISEVSTKSVLFIGQVTEL